MKASSRYHQVSHTAAFFSSVVVLLIATSSPSAGQGAAPTCAIPAANTTNWLNNSVSKFTTLLSGFYHVLPSGANGNLTTIYETCSAYHADSNSSRLRTDSWSWLRRSLAEVDSFVTNHTVLNTVGLTRQCDSYAVAVESFIQDWIFDSSEYEISASRNQSLAFYYLSIGLSFYNDTNHLNVLQSSLSTCMSSFHQLPSTTAQSQVQNLEAVVRELANRTALLVSQVNRVRRFVDHINELQVSSFQLAGLWSVLPTAMRKWQYGSTVGGETFGLLQSLSNVGCSMLAKYMVISCGAASPLGIAAVGGSTSSLNVPLSSVDVCAVQPSPEALHTSVSFLRYLGRLVHLNTARFGDMVTCLQQAVQSALQQQKACPVVSSAAINNHSTAASGSMTAAAASAAAAGGVAVSTPCLNLACPYPLTPTHVPGLREISVRDDLVAIIRLVGLATKPNISSEFKCARSCRDVFSFGETLFTKSLLYLDSGLTIIILSVYLYALYCIIINWRKISERLHWRSLLYINIWLFVQLVVSHSVKLDKGLWSECADNGELLLGAPLADSPATCQLSALVTDMSDNVFPILVLWQAFIWYSYVRKVTVMRPSSSTHWHRNMKIAERLIGVVVLAVMAIPAGARYKELLVDGQPFGLPCRLVFSAIPHSSILSLIELGVALVLLIVTLVYFVKTSVVRKKIWKIPVIGHSWKRTQSTISSGAHRTNLDVDTIMQDFQGRIAIFVLVCILYRGGLEAVSLAEKSIIPDAYLAMIGSELDTSVHCQVFSCNLAECPKRFTFTEKVQFLFLPRFIYKLVLDLLSCLLLSFISFAGFKRPLHEFMQRRRPGMEPDTPPSSVQSHPPSVQMPSMQRDESQASIQSGSLPPTGRGPGRLAPALTGTVEQAAGGSQYMASRCTTIESSIDPTISYQALSSMPSNVDFQLTSLVGDDLKALNLVDEGSLAIQRISDSSEISELTEDPSSRSLPTSLHGNETVLTLGNIQSSHSDLFSGKPVSPVAPNRHSMDATASSPYFVERYNKRAGICKSFSLPHRGGLGTAVTESVSDLLDENSIQQSGLA